MQANKIFLMKRLWPLMTTYMLMLIPYTPRKRWMHCIYLINIMYAQVIYITPYIHSNTTKPCLHQPIKTNMVRR